MGKYTDWALAKRAEMQERETLIERLRAERDELTTLKERLEERLSVQVWAELDSGASVAVGARVRYFGRTYVCVKAHTKALIRSPSHEEYWEIAEP